MSKKSFAMLFPGQGSQSLGMLHELAAEFPMVEKLFYQASDILGYDVWILIQHGPEEKLNQTEFTQPALLTAEYAMWQCWLENGGEKPAILAGHSLGEYTALVCADSLEFADALRLVSDRGRFMQNAVTKGEGAMAAIIGLDEKAVIDLCEEAKKNNEILSPANYNSVGQIVIAGHRHSVENAIEIAKKKGAKLAKMIPVSVPSHCALMKKAAENLSQKLNQISFKSPTIPVIQNYDVKIHSDPNEIREKLISQLTNPVRWVETIQLIVEKSIHSAVECGPGKVLAGLNKRITKEMNTYNFHNAVTLKEIIASQAS